MSKPQRGMPRSLVRSTSPRAADSADGQAEPEAQGRGGQPAEPARRVKRAKDPEARELKVVGVPADIFTRLELEAIASRRSLSAITIEALNAYLPRHYMGTKGARAEQQPAGGDDAEQVPGDEFARAG